MTRNFDTQPLEAAFVDELLDLARRAPSAGFSQGAHWLVLTGEALADFWTLTEARDWFASSQPGVLDAPVVILALADPTAYTSRYSESDKAGHGLHDAAAWPVPYWLTDAAMAVQNLLLLAEDRGIGALYFGIFRNAEHMLQSFGVPASLTAIGAVALGQRSADDTASGSARTHRRRSAEQVIHHQHW